MAPERARRLSLLLAAAALLALAAASVFALRTPPPPNSDRYDYVGRAWHLERGEGLRPLVVYPLRMVEPGAGTWPPSNLTRPPLWPVLLVPGVRLGLDHQAGVILAGLLALLLAAGLRAVGDSTFGGGAGGLAALAFAASWTTWGVLWGGGPEIGLAGLVLVLWTWIPRGGGRVQHLACGSLYGLLPLLHPTGWIFAGAALLARPGRYGRAQLPWLGLGFVAVAAPWHAALWLQTGHPLGLLQGSAELARNLDDPGGLGPYRGLEPHPTPEVLAQRGGEVVRLGLHRLRMHLLHLGAWIPWPLGLLALAGAWHERTLALRDLLLGAAVFALLAPFSAELRTLLPLLPVACLWSGAGFARLGGRLPGAGAAALGVAAVLLPWLLPLGAGPAPAAWDDPWPLHQRRPPAALVQRLRAELAPAEPFLTDAAVLAWEARRSALFVPDRPSTLTRLRARPPLTSLRLWASGAGAASPWTAGAAWDSLRARCEPLLLHPDGPTLHRLP